jgi:hypothetical protein
MKQVSILFSCSLVYCMPNYGSQLFYKTIDSNIASSSVFDRKHSIFNFIFVEFLNSNLKENKNIIMENLIYL